MACTLLLLLLLLLYLADCPSRDGVLRRLFHFCIIRAVSSSTANKDASRRVSRLS